MSNHIYQSTPEPIQDNTKRAQSLIITFWVIIGCSFLAMLSGYYELLLLERIQLDKEISYFEISISEFSQGMLGISQTILFIIASIMFIRWFRRAYANLHRSGIKYLKHKENMAVWSFFIPIVSLYWPYQIMKEIWSETQYQIKKLDPRYSLQNGEWMIGVWWALFIISGIIGNFIFRSTLKEETLEQAITGSQALILSDFLDIPEALLVILIVKKVAAMESTWAKNINTYSEEIKEPGQLGTESGI